MRRGEERVETYEKISLDAGICSGISCEDTRFLDDEDAECKIQAYSRPQETYLIKDKAVLWECLTYRLRTFPAKKALLAS